MSATSELRAALAEVLALCEHHTIPLAHTRTNIVPGPGLELAMPRSELFGAYTRRGSGITNRTRKCPELVAAMHRVASHLRSPEHSGAYTSIQLNRHTGMKLHRDEQNEGLSFIIACGEYTGGRLWVEDTAGDEPPPHARTEEELGLRGIYHDVHEKFLVFDGMRLHAAEASEGLRMSMIFFTPQNLKQLSSQTWEELSALGFPAEAEAIGALHKRYRAVKARAKYHHKDDEELQGICREAWRLQLG
jgi:hypothetical protein